MDRIGMTKQQNMFAVPRKGPDYQVFAKPIGRNSLDFDIKP